MRKLLRTKDKLLLTAAILGDGFSDLVSASIEARAERRLDFWKDPHKPSAFYQSLQRLLKTGSIEKVIKKGRPYLRFTSAGKEKFYRDFPLFRFQDQRWRGVWCVVSYDIPEKKKYERNLLREKLKRLGFGAWQRSIFISPHNFGEDIRDWLESEKLQGYVSVSQATNLSPDEKLMARHVFKLKSLEEEYHDLLDKYYDAKSSRDLEKLSKIYDSYLLLLAKDPFLPKELLPEDWIGLKLRRVMCGEAERW